MVIIASTGRTSAQIGNSATDFHEYTDPNTLVSQFGKWDNTASKQNLRIVGEYSAYRSNAKQRHIWPTWIGAVAETVFSLGVERNSYGMIGMCYAPLLQNVNSVQWTVCIVDTFCACLLSIHLKITYSIVLL